MWIVRVEADISLSYKHMDRFANDFRENHCFTGPLLLPPKRYLKELRVNNLNIKML